MAQDPISVLQTKYPIWVFKNRTSIPQIIYLSGGDSIQAQANVEVRVQSNLFTQLPSFSIFEPIVPSLNDLVSEGVIKTSGEASAVKETFDEEVAKEKPATQIGGKTFNKS